MDVDGEPTVASDAWNKPPPTFEDSGYSSSPFKQQAMAKPATVAAAAAAAYEQQQMQLEPSDGIGGDSMTATHIDGDVGPYSRDFYHRNGTTYLPVPVLASEAQRRLGGGRGACPNGWRERPSWLLVERPTGSCRLTRF
jgi:hypothetical protein